MGRRLFGRWHLGLGRPQLPIAVCDVEQCAGAMAWCVTHFEEAPRGGQPASIPRSRHAARCWRACEARGWDGRMIWVPISLRCAGHDRARVCLARWPGPLAREACGLVGAPAAAVRHTALAGAARGGRVTPATSAAEGQSARAGLDGRHADDQGPRYAMSSELMSCAKHCSRDRRRPAAGAGHHPVARAPRRFACWSARSIRLSLASASRYCAERVTYPSPSRTPDAFARVHARYRRARADRRRRAGDGCHHLRMASPRSARAARGVEGWLDGRVVARRSTRSSW